MIETLETVLLWTMPPCYAIGTLIAAVKGALYERSKHERWCRQCLRGAVEYAIVWPVYLLSLL